MKRPRWSTTSSTRASVSVENLFDEEVDSEEHLAPNTTASEFDGGFEDELSERSSRPMDANENHDDSDDAEVETKVLKDRDDIMFNLIKLFIY